MRILKEIDNFLCEDKQLKIKFLKGRFDRVVADAENWEKKLLNMVFNYVRGESLAPISWKLNKIAYDYSFTKGNELVVEITFDLTELFKKFWESGDIRYEEEGEEIFVSLESDLNKLSRSAIGNYKAGKIATITCQYISEEMF